ncbi:LuxR C-terminal-related transcriptional regulator [Streptomyces sp. NPDC007971]|uniref:helix-turn-helix transcriptional regulator n=1 Tax=Streptomyces sp. NPDC007971 TaxID=3364799 RepID=UPI0036E72C06
MQTGLTTPYAEPLAEVGDPEELYRLAIRCQILDVEQSAEELGWDHTRMAQAVGPLMEGGLLRPLADDHGVLVPVAPRAAASRRLAPLHSQIAQMERRSEQIRAELAVFQEVHERALRETSLAEPLQTIAGADAIAAEITAAVEASPAEILVVCPAGSGGGAARRGAWELPEPTLDRLAGARFLYQHVSRFDSAARKRVERILAAGGEVRTLGDSFERMIVIDRELAFVPAAGDADSAVAIRQPAVVNFLVTVFERAWVSARPFETQNRSADVSEVVSSVRMSIIQLLAEGETDVAIARRIGLSVRTCRAHVAKIYEGLGARSRCQLGVLIAQSGLLDEG